MKHTYLVSAILFLALTFSVHGQNREQKKMITSRYNLNEISNLQKQFNATALKNKQEAVLKAQQNNWPIIIEEDGTYAELQSVTPDGTPIYYTTFNVDAAESTRTNHLNIGGSLGLSLDGQNMTAHVWDGGIARSTHQEYDGPGGNDRFSVGDGSNTLNFHAAHVTGTIIASGVQPAAKGMAPQSDAVGYDWNSDLAEATAAAGNGMLISNHSYGFRSDQVPDYFFGAYITNSRDWDNLMFNAPNYLMVVAAGNDGNTNFNAAPLNGNSAYDKLTGHSVSKNNMVVANAQDANVDASGNLVSVLINSGSSEGPTDDLRIKPDITGNGTGVYSTYENTDTAYNSISGTSMASPNVAGSLLLLQQHANNLNGSFMRASTLKGLALHTADDAGPTGPDAVYGWGLMNAKRAAETLTNEGSGSQIDELTLATGQTYQITVDSDGINDLVASISWTDRPGTATTATNSSTPILVNDLDLRITQGGTTYSPWRLTGVDSNGKGDNNVDPFELVEVANASGSYTITVTHKGSLVGNSQNYSLIITGLSSAPVVCNATTPTNATVTAFADITATVNWDPIAGASYTARYREVGGSWITIPATNSAINLNGLTPQTSYEVQVSSQCPDNSSSNFSNSVAFTTTELQLNYCILESTNTNDEFISRVQLNTIDNTSGATNYSNFTNISTDLSIGNSYTVSVTPTWTGTVYTEGYAVWIDFNKDGDFVDTGELVFSQSPTSASPVSGSFTIPAGAIEGNTRMRVAMRFNQIPGPCGSFTFGEVEDYTVNIVGSTPVEDTVAPIISLVGNSNVEFEQGGGSYNEEGATATDNVDGDITSDIVIGGDTVNPNVVGTYVITYNVSDAAGNAATQITRTVNVLLETVPPTISLIGNNIIDLETGDTYNELGATATDNFDGDISSDIVIAGDNVDTSNAGTYVVTYDVSDAAGNAASRVSRTINVTEPVVTSCIATETLPYSEGFENTLGGWTQNTDDDLNWTIDANGTPSGSTGPNNASEGNFYIYVEASGNGTGYPNKRAIITSPCFEITGLTNPTLSFDYNMHGSTNMGTLDLEISTDNGLTWSSLWSETGNKGSQWFDVLVDLTPYIGDSIQFRFNRLVGGTWQADVALDNIEIVETDDGSVLGCSNFDLNRTYIPFSGQDNGTYQLQNANSELVISNNAWKYVDLNYTVTPNTVIEFDFASTLEGEIHGIAFESDNNLSSNVIFKVHGTQNYGITTFDNYPNNGQWVNYSINVGSFYTGTSDRLVFIADHDGGARNGNSLYRNVVIFEDTNGNGICDDTEFSTQSLLAGDYSSPIQGDFSTEGLDMVIHPNPVTGNSLNLKITKNLDNPRFKITNLLGQIVEEGRLMNNRIDVNRLQAGVYLLEVSDSAESITKRFIVQ